MFKIIKVTRLNSIWFVYPFLLPSFPEPAEGPDGQDDAVPEGHEGDSQEEPQGAPELRHQGGEGVEQHLLLHPSVGGHCPDTHWTVVVGKFGRCVGGEGGDEQLVVMVLAGLPAPCDVPDCMAVVSIVQGVVEGVVGPARMELL